MFSIKSDQPQKSNKPDDPEGNQDSEGDKDLSWYFVSTLRPTMIWTDDFIGGGDGDSDGISNWDHKGQDHYHKVYNVEPMTEMFKVLMQVYNNNDFRNCYRFRKNIFGLRVKILSAISNTK